MSLPLRTYSALVAQAVAATQGACSSLIDMAVGTPLRAIMEAMAGVGLWQQYIALLILSRSRLATSEGADADSWVADFGMGRMPGTASTGPVTLTSFQPDQQSASVQVGAIVRTVAGMNFAVLEDSTNAAWSAETQSYVRPSGTGSISVPVVCQTPGSGGNVNAGAICLLGTSIAGIDTVTNEVAFVNGSDGETDAQLRARFPEWLAAKATASNAAIENAIAGVQTNLTWQILNCQATDGSFRPGYFTVVVDDGTGTPSDTLVASVYAAIDAVRADGIGFAVIGPIEVLATVSMTVTVPAGTATALVQTNIQNAITADIDQQKVGAGYAYSRLPVVAYNNAGVDIVSITSVLLNGAQADLAAESKQVIRAGTVTVNVLETAS
ncbi:Phage baseplate [Acetobacter malorum]|uniref:Phage baseplate n=1 Tax=Acetobacter malorum TaxID=178901 RepID=A0A177G6T9_9PROT|nr:baseplate J/gp47 family protein [Acetobacter malorum]OAG75982.1 Phage baseplate [Acetobacter malorum]